MATLDTKQRIKQAATELVMQYGIRSVSMDDIATNLGISKKTIYLYFKDKDELVDEIVDDIIVNNRYECNADRGRAENAIHEIFLVMDMMAEMFTAMNPGILFDMQKYHPATYRKFLKHKNEFLYNVCRENLERGKQEELYRPDLAVDILCRYRVETMFIPFNPDFHQSLKYNLAKIEEEIIIHFLFGLVSIKGYKLVMKYWQQRESKKN
ncbi:MAG: TetR/AcrR family transcriptional regulator [Chitinophagaceae bacterium]|nr:TetR/AcrR family transcriptional regulator [Chitinophagaceae bacterium]MCC7379586.1 TetR/AcrR family transcriptional regulator [Chitinophagaceae bacterium]